VRAVDGRLELYFTRVGDAPEHILKSTVDLAGDWLGWTPSPPKSVLRPELEWEGASAPVVASRGGIAQGRVCQLRDPCVLEDEGATYLFYAAAGESGIGVTVLA
jgi:hypothetical protein